MCMRSLVLVSGLLMIAPVGLGAQEEPPKKEQEQKQEKKKLRKDPRVISQEELDELRLVYRDTYELVQKARPRFLRTRGGGGIPPAALGATGGTGQIVTSDGPRAAVYLDGRPFGDLESLRQISTQSLVEIRWLSATEATSRFGMGNTDGAILVTTIRSPQGRP